MKISSHQFHQFISRPGVNQRLPLLFFSCMIMALSFSACEPLRHAALHRPTVWRCEALVRDTVTHEPIRVTSDLPFNPLPARAAPRLFIDTDWNGDGVRNSLDVVTDWRRYIANNILRSSGFAGRRWCVDADSVNCDQTGAAFVPLPPTLPAESLTSCRPERSDALLSVSATDLTAPDFRLSFPDTPVGVTSAAITVTLRNEGGDSLRVISTDLLGAAADLDFLVPAGGTSCLPTADEMRRGVGHELAGRRICAFQVQFRPQFRPGVAECDRDDTTLTTCTRLASLRITSTTLGGRMLPTVILHLSGRAIGGRMVVEPASREICFPPGVLPLAHLECAVARFDQTITIRNEGSRVTTGDLNITSAASVPIESFHGNPPDIIGRTLTPGQSVDVRVRYCERGDRGDGVYRIYSSAPRGPNPVEISIYNPNNRTCP